MTPRLKITSMSKQILEIMMSTITQVETFASAPVISILMSASKLSLMPTVLALEEEVITEVLLVPKS